MKKEKVSASGEKAAMGGYLPQFDEFAWFVYLNLVNKKLEWIRIADPKAEKLDDIQYSTFSEIHAYQVKWTIADAKISFANFTDLIPKITSSWKKLKKDNPGKKIIPHLITNKPTSSHDSLKDGKTIVGSFKKFISEVLLKIKLNQLIDDKWKPILENFKNSLNLNDSEFEEFIYCFDFQPDYKPKRFSISNVKCSKEDEDLQQISRFIIEKVASPERVVEYNRQEIIRGLDWGDRFKTIFNHELIVDKQRYQPIQSTIDLLNSKLSEYKNGYLFLQGGPGSGKSTLLNQWSKDLKTRIVRYYAFDFVNPSSHLNFYERGNATHLFFDLVFQLKEAGIYKSEILPYKDLLFLKDVFNEQLKAIGQDYVTGGQSTIIIIDGLDHVPREYKSTTNSFLRELPLPSSLPEGVFIILGSQSYELDDIQQEIKTEFQKGDRTIQIDALSKEAVYKYITTIDSSTQFSNSQKQQIFEKSQGHPLYLSYLIEKINKSNCIDDIIESFGVIDGSIDNYYKKIWEPIQQDNSLIHFMGLIARINGSINIKFIREWGFERNLLKSFKEKARVLFNETEKTWSFFHNSFKQFLLYYTSLDYLTDEFDQDENLKYHNQLAGFYSKSKVEKSWKQNYHLFQAKEYDKFIAEVSPDNFTDELLNFRPVDDIKQDVKLGIEIARQTKDINILTRYLFLLSEIERRLYNIDPASFTEEFLILNKFDIARDYLRTGNTLHCSSSYALKASRLFIKYGCKYEGVTLFNLAYPEVITDSEIVIEDSYRYEEIRDTLEEWVYTSPYFQASEKILSKIENISFLNCTLENRFDERKTDLFFRLLANFGYSLIDQNKWDDFNNVINKIELTCSKGRNLLFHLYKYSIEKCLDLNDTSHANQYLSLLTTYFTKEKTKPIGKIYISDLVYQVTRDIDATYSWIKDVQQPSNVGKQERLVDDGSLESFMPLIKLNKLLNLCNKGVSIISAIPSVEQGSDEEVLVEFERMLCLISQILSDGILKKRFLDNIKMRFFPIVRFYYKKNYHRNIYWYRLTQYKEQYFDFLISSVSELGSENLNILGDYLFNEFIENRKYWSTSIKREIIKSLVSKGFEIKKAVGQLKSLEECMFDDQDIDGRITECLAHSKVWLFLGDLKEGEKWLKQAIQESIGVGYRKDYQFSTWITWLRKINLKNSSNAISKIKWFLSHLSHIKETTEGRAYLKASKELLEVTYEHSLYDGLEQTIWQLDHNLIYFEDSMSLFIKYYITRVKTKEEFHCIIELYTDLYLLLLESADISVLKFLFIKGYEVLKDEFLDKYVPKIISAINIKAYEENRDELFTEIHDFFSSKGLIIEDYYSAFKIPINKERDSSSHSSNILVLKSNQEGIEESKVLEQIVTFDDFKTIVQEEDQVNSYFNWSKVIEKITPLLSSTKIQEVVNIPRIGRRVSDFYVKLSEAAFKQEDHQLAASLANKSIELSSESGWVKYYDGGSRINAFNALKKVNPTLSADKAFEVFAHDIVNGDYPSIYIEHLESIVPLLTENYKEEELWEEIFGYLQRLMANSKPIEGLPVLLSINQPILETFVDYLIYLSENLIPFIKEQAIILLAKCINKNNKYAITQLLNGTLDDYNSMDVIMALSELNSSMIHEVKSKIQDLALSNDYLLRKNSQHILSKLGESAPVSSRKNLPSIYSLEIPELRNLEKKDINPYFPEVNINDPRDLIRPFDFIIRILSEESGIEESNLIYRVYSIMKEIGKEEEWIVEYEKELRSHMSEIYLKYSYPRPRVITARRAIMHVTNELIDSGIIDDKRIHNLIISNDYSVPFFYEIAKPEFIQTIKERDFGGVGNDWLDRISESKRLNETLLDYNEHFKIIGEYNQVRNLEWGSPTEEYMCQIAIFDELDKEDSSIFRSVFQQLSKSYHDLCHIGPSIIVIRDHRYNQFDLKSNWIAFNPELARCLGWEPELTKLFAWKNSYNELMVESIYWCNGNTQMTPYKKGEVGEGWLVIISVEGLEQIKSIVPNLFLQKKIKRFKYEDTFFKNKQIFDTKQILK